MIALIDSDFFSLGDPARYRALVDYLRGPDPFMICADFDAYLAAEAEAAELYRKPHEFARAPLMNVAGAGAFSSDATIAAYARDIWNVHPVKADLSLAGNDR